MAKSRFNGLSSDRSTKEAVETANISGLWHGTGLKPGVNEMGAEDASRWHFKNDFLKGIGVTSE